MYVDMAHPFCTDETDKKTQHFCCNSSFYLLTYVSQFFSPLSFSKHDRYKMTHIKVLFQRAIIFGFVRKPEIP